MLATGAILNVDLNGTAAGQYDLLNVVGTVNLNSDVLYCGASAVLKR